MFSSLNCLLQSSSSSSFFLNLFVRLLHSLKCVFPNITLDLLNERTGEEFKVNGQRVESYLGESLHNTKVTFNLHEFS